MVRGSFTRTGIHGNIKGEVSAKVVLMRVGFSSVWYFKSSSTEI